MTAPSPGSPGPGWRRPVRRGPRPRRECPGGIDPAAGAEAGQRPGGGLHLGPVHVGPPDRTQRPRCSRSRCPGRTAPARRGPQGEFLAISLPSATPSTTASPRPAPPGATRDHALPGGRVPAPGRGPAVIRAPSPASSGSATGARGDQSSQQDSPRAGSGGPRSGSTRAGGVLRARARADDHVIAGAERVAAATAGRESGPLRGPVTCQSPGVSPSTAPW